MKRALTVSVAVACLLLWAGPALAAPQPIYIQNLSTELPDSELVDALPAFQSAVSEDFATVWNADAKLIFVADDQATPLGWTIDLVDQPNCWFCAGYHELKDHLPYSEVGVADDWQGTFAHELFEILADPYINRGMLIGKKWYALEVCDPVEATVFDYTRPSATGRPVHISDFVTEAWYRRGSRGPYDFAGHVQRPLQILKDGYQLIWRNSAWTSGKAVRHTSPRGLRRGIAPRR